MQGRKLPSLGSIWVQRQLRSYPALLRSFLLILRATPALVAISFAAAISFSQTASPNGDGWVVLPVSEYAALRHAAFPAEADSPPPAVEATLSRLDYDLKVDGDLASGEARLTIDVIRDGWVRVPLPIGLMVRGET